MKKKRKTRIHKIKLSLLRELRYVESGIGETNKKLEQSIENNNKQVEINEKVEQYSSFYNPMRFIDYSNLEYITMLNYYYKQRKDYILSQLKSLNSKRKSNSKSGFMISIDTETSGLRIF